MINLEKPGDPVTFVRSPMFTKSVSSPILSGSRPARRVRCSIVGTCRGGRPLSASAIALIWAGVVPQQPPATLMKPL